MNEQADRLVGLLAEDYDDFDEALANAQDFADQFGVKMFVLTDDDGLYKVSDHDRGELEDDRVWEVLPN